MAVENDHDQLKRRVQLLENQIAQMARSRTPRAIRHRSNLEVFGLPLYDIAMGPDPERGEVRGHARGFFAVGDVATGVFAFGGLARGLVAAGGCALGIFVAVGGLAVGGLAVGGAAVGGVAIGGGAIGVVAIGGGAIGQYAIGGGAFGQHVLSPVQRDPLLVELAERWFGS